MTVWDKLGMIYERERPDLYNNKAIIFIAETYLPFVVYSARKAMIIKLCLMKNLSPREKKKLLQRLANDRSFISTFITTIAEDMPTGLKARCYNV